MMNLLNKLRFVCEGWKLAAVAFLSLTYSIWAVYLSLPPDSRHPLHRRAGADQNLHSERPRSDLRSLLLLFTFEAGPRRQSSRFPRPNSWAMHPTWSFYHVCVDQ